MSTIAGLGAGKIGRMAAHFLRHSGDYRVRVGDAHQSAVDRVVDTVRATEGQVVDFSSDEELDRILDGATAVI